MPANPTENDPKIARRYTLVAKRMVNHSRNPFESIATAAERRLAEEKAAIRRQIADRRITDVVGRERLAVVAANLKSELKAERDKVSIVPKAFVGALAREAQDRPARRMPRTLEERSVSLAERTAKAMESMVLEQQLVTRKSEFEGLTFSKLTGQGPASTPPTPVFDKLLALADWARRAGDPAASEFARRQLEAMRPMRPTPEDQAAIDAAVERDDLISPGRVTAIVDAFTGKDDATLAKLAEGVWKAGGVSDWAALYALAERHTMKAGDNDPIPAWVAETLAKVRDLPDDALTYLRKSEADRYALAIADVDEVIELSSLVMDDEAEIHETDHSGFATTYSPIDPGSMDVSQPRGIGPVGDAVRLAKLRAETLANTPPPPHSKAEAILPYNGRP